MLIVFERRRFPAWFFVRLRALWQVEYARFEGICCFHVIICVLSWTEV